MEKNIKNLSMKRLISELATYKQLLEVYEKSTIEQSKNLRSVLKEINEKEEELRIIYDGMLDGLLLADIETKRLLKCNHNVCEMLGYTTTELLKLTVMDIHPHERLSFVMEQFEKASKGLIQIARNIPCVRKNGSVFFSDISAKLIKFRGRKCLEGVLRDVTERIKSEENIKKKNEDLQTACNDLKNTQSQLLQSEKMASIGQLAAGVAHEINNPIGFISSNLNVLSGFGYDIKKIIEKYEELRRSNNQEKTWQELDNLIQEIDLNFLLNDFENIIRESQEGTERVKKIVKDLKDFSHIDEAELKYADINKGLESTLNIVWNEIKYKAEVIKEYGELPEILCHPMQLNQVFMNILVNAVQAIEKKGKIKIVSRDLKNNTIEIRISDTGIGISKENLGKIFDPFFTTKEVGQGTGLGLSMAYGIIQNHGGSIEVESQIGQGTTFIVKLPVKSSGD